MKKYYILLLPLFLTLTACDSFLSIKPKAEIVEDVFFDTPEGFEDALYGVYSKMSQTSLYGEHLTWGLLDQFAQYYTKANTNDNDRYKLTLNHEELKGFYSMIWRSDYEVIGYINNVIRNLDRVGDKNLPHYKLYRGEALGLRAFLHFDLVRLYAPHFHSKPDEEAIPYVSIYQAMVSPFKTVREVYELVLKDLQEAESLMTQDEELLTFPRDFDKEKHFLTARQIHFNLYAVQATMARVYMEMGDKENALLYAKKVIDSGKFPFVDKLQLETFVAGKVSGYETIFGLYTTKLVDPLKENFYTYAPDRTWLPANDMFDLYSVPQEEGNDMRSGAWFRTLKGDDEHDNVRRCLKIVNESQITDDGESNTGMIDGINLIRISEMYLIAAECLLESDPEEAQRYFDALIVSRGLYKYADCPGDKHVSMASILKERRKEFVQEGQYFYTLKRLNKDFYCDAIKTDLKASNELFTLLIPDEEYEYRYTEEDEQEENKESK